MEPKMGYDYLGKEEDFVMTPISTGVSRSREAGSLAPLYLFGLLAARTFVLH